MKKVESFQNRFNYVLTLVSTDFMRQEINKIS